MNVIRHQDDSKQLTCCFPWCDKEVICQCTECDKNLCKQHDDGINFNKQQNCCFPQCDKEVICQCTGCAKNLCIHHNDGVHMNNDGKRCQTPKTGHCYGCHADRVISKKQLKKKFPRCDWCIICYEYADRSCEDCITPVKCPRCNT